MKRFCLIAVVTLLWFGRTLAVVAEESLTAAAIADRTVAEERYHRLNGAIEDLAVAQTSLKQKLERKSETLDHEMRNLREEIERSKIDPAKFASAEYVRELAKKLQEIEDRRQADK